MINDYKPETPNKQELDWQTECQNHMIESGIKGPDYINTNGKFQRWSAEGNPAKKNEWLVGYEGTSARGNKWVTVIYDSWTRGEYDPFVFKSWDKNKSFNESEKQELEKEYKKKREDAERQLQQEHDRAAKEAEEIYQKGSKTPPSEEYLYYTKAKGIEPLGDVIFTLNPTNYPSIGIPISNTKGQKRSMQFISMGDASENSYKTFLSDGEKKGNFFTLGNIINGNPIYIAEGYATSVSVYMALEQKCSTIMACDAGNLDPVIGNLKKEYPNSPITIAGDSDDVGRAKALAAAKKYGCKVVFPDFPKMPEYKPYKDFNDLHKIAGLVEVKANLKEHVLYKKSQILCKSYWTKWIITKLRSWHLNYLKKLIHAMTFQ